MGCYVCTYSTLEEAAKADLEKALHIDGNLGADLRGYVLVGLGAKQAADRLYDRLKVVCDGMFDELGANGQKRDAMNSCDAVAHELTRAREKMGPRTQIKLDTRPPHCTLPDGGRNVCVESCTKSLTSERSGFSCTLPDCSYKNDQDACEIFCTSQTLNQATCQPALIEVSITGADDLEAEAKFKTVVRKYLGEVMILSSGMRPENDTFAEQVKVIKNAENPQKSSILIYGKIDSRLGPFMLCLGTYRWRTEDSIAMIRAVGVYSSRVYAAAVGQAALGYEANFAR